MPDPISANYVFLPWVRQGAASGIQTVDSLSPTQTGVVSVPVKLFINNTVDDPVARQLRLYGPGDVTGIDPQQVVRTEPRHLAMDFEPNYFPAIEFDRPDFPWLFTPAKADADGKLRPWLCLVVVRKQEGVTLRIDRNLPVAVLDIKAPARPRIELPDLSESPAWAHVQVMGSPPEHNSLRRSLAGDPALTVSRLLCPRRLDPATEYLACVVPAFEVGCKAALGSSIVAEDEKMKPAWASGDQSPAQVTLPVYFHWEFRTGADGDFESLCESLKARAASDVPAEVGKRRMDISRPGFQITQPLPLGTTLELEGALRLFKAPTAEWPEPTRSHFQADLKKILDAPWEAMKHEDKEPLVAPPIYGCWQAGRHTVQTGSTPSSTPWLDELNLDPRHRAVAALGTAVVQTQQEQLMGSAWEQLGEIERINQMKRQAQFGLAVNTVYHAKHFARFSEEALLKVVASAQSRLVVGGTGPNTTRTMLSQRITQSAMPDRALSAPLRRLTSPRSRVSRRFQAATAPAISIVATLNTMTSILALQGNQAGMGVTIDKVTNDQSGPFATGLKQVVTFERISNALTTAPGLGDFQILAEGSKRSILDFLPGMTDSIEAKAFRDAAKAHHQLVQSALLPPQSLSAPRMELRLSEMKKPLLESLDPENTINARVKASVGSTDGADALEPILDAPVFPHPMYEALRDLSQDFLLPGLEHVPKDTVMLLETNSKFVESFLVGLNTEMNRELLWRDYPTDQRRTYFQHFWDKSSADEQPAGNEEGDIQPISAWGNRKLGENARAREKLVLLVRGELLRRYPNSVIYAVAAEPKNGLLDLSPAKGEKRPVFRGTLKPDVTFLGFDLDVKDAIEGFGWFFVIQQQPTEPSFGMDVANFTQQQLPPPKTRDDLSWRHLANTQEQLNALSHASTKTALPQIEKATWGRNSAHQAYLTLQRPVRIAIHAREMIKQG